MTTQTISGLYASASVPTGRRGGGAFLDALAQKDAAGLPYLPGRTVKGLLRDAVCRLEHWGHAPENITCILFGSIGVNEGVTRLETDPGALALSDARMPEAAWLAQDTEENKDFRQALFRQFSTTAIEHDSGTAKRGSLRSVEAAVPVTLEARLEIIRPEQLLAGGREIIKGWAKYLQQALPLIRAVGVSRSRGLGRVNVTLLPFA
ncbi:MAG: hypothetical protein GY862_38945 [Gammaproteobacteria bacterium]|nr:hypothetical protein [Gammaproteobacteria bacterium]